MLIVRVPVSGGKFKPELCAIVGAVAPDSSAVGEDYSPISDHRAGKEYRAKVAGNLFLRLYHDLSGIDKALEVMAV